MRKMVLLIFGFISLVLGVIGSAVPILPTFPFLLVAAISFGKSSEKLNKWFKNTKLYKNNVESYAKGQGMTICTKIKICATISILMIIGFLMMGNVPIGRIVLFFVWIFHLVYFLFFVKTIKKIIPN